ncbi:probable cytochrome P450 303a1 [Hetaerina americana]|uniref:probable cytochrome P450 303a1 n=1 Tax=Hetaerina americana TaxID=62018 RepID=UPI003A7F41E6
MRCESGGTNVLSRALVSLARDYRTDLLGIKVGKDRIVVLCSHEVVREVLSRDEFDGRPKGLFFETRTWGSRKGIILVDGMLWHSQRRFLLRHLKDFGFDRRSMEELVQKEVSELSKYFLSAIQKGECTTDDKHQTGSSPKPNLDVNCNEQGKEATIWLHNAFSVSVLNTIWMMMAGVRYEPGDKDLRELQSILADLFIVVDTTGCPFSHFPFLRFIAPEMSGYNMFVSTHQKIWDFLYKELERHKTSFQPDICRDFMDLFLKKVAEEESAGVKHSEFSDAQLLATCMDLFMAGSETTSKGLGFVFLYLIKHPRVQKKVQEEIDAVVGRDRLPDLSDRVRMPYLEAMIMESLRLFTARSFGLAHRALADAWIKGHFIPKDTMLLVCFASISYNEQLWSEPEKFYPERFLDAEGQVVVPHHYLPFGLGKRRCMGESLAKTSIFLFISGLLQKYEFSVPEGDTPPPIEGTERTGVTPTPLPYRATIRLRR